jgi:hypothetical protein
MKWFFVLVIGLWIQNAPVPFSGPTPTPAPVVIESGPGSTNGAGPLTLFAPTTRVSGDLWVAFVYEHLAGSGSPLGLSGWTQIFNEQGYSWMAAWYFRYNGTIPNLVVNRADTGNTGAILGHVVVVRGAGASGSPIDGLSGRTWGSDASIEYLSITTTIPNSLVILVDGAAHDYARGPAPAGTTLIDWLHVQAGHVWGSMAEYRDVNGTPGPTGTNSSTLSPYVPTGWPWDSQVFAIRP